MAPDELNSDALVALLAPTLGDERAREVVRGAMTACGFPDGELTNSAASQILELIGRTPGFVGSVARFAYARFMLREAPASGPRRRGSVAVSATGAGEPGAPVEGGAFTLGAVAALLAPTLGREKADEVVQQSVQALGYPPSQLSRSQALAVLELLAQSGGLTSVASRFAKAHLLMHDGRVASSTDR